MMNLLISASLLAAIPWLLGAPTACSQEEFDFAHDVLPILKNHCAECHTNGTYQGGFSIDDRAAILDAGAVDLDEPDASEMIFRITSDDPDYRMPPEGPRLSDEQIDRLQSWIAQGLVWQPGFSFNGSSWQPPIVSQPPDLPPGDANPIDRILARYFAEHQIQPPPKVNDARFLRRVYLDLLGILPTLSELQAFLADPSADKRTRLIDNLLARDRDYADHWISFWNDLLRNDYAGTGYIDGGRKSISVWLHQSLYTNKPYDQFVRELINPGPASAGFINGIKWRGDINASQTTDIQFAQNVAQVFLGENLKCASCHNSFIDEWKLEDAYAFAAITAEQPLEMYQCDNPTGQVATAGFLWPQLGTIDPKRSRSERLGQLSELMTSPENGRLGRTIANRLWQRLLGRPIVEPVDMMSNPPFEADLINLLEVALQASDYDIKQLLRLITTSEIYQAQIDSQPASDASPFCGPVARRMTAEQFTDAIWWLTDTAPRQAHPSLRGYLKSLEKEAGFSVPVRASLVEADPLMRSLGRPNREQVVTTRPAELSTLQALDLSNGDILFARIRQRAAQFNGAPAGDADRLIDQLYQRALCRKPTPEEKQILKDALGDQPNTEQIADIIWSIVMLPEFQHVW